MSLLGVEALVVDEDLVAAGLAAQVVLGQRRALVGTVELGADEHDAPVEALGPQGLGGLGAGQAGADDQERLLRGHGSPRVAACAGRRGRVCLASAAGDLLPSGRCVRGGRVTTQTDHGTRAIARAVAFVLSGGASLGAIQAGMLHALYERGIAPDLIVGTSAGALNGAFIASRPQTVATADGLATIWRGLRRGQAFPLNPLTGLLGFLGARDHLVPAVRPAPRDRGPPRARRAGRTCRSRCTSSPSTSSRARSCACPAGRSLDAVLASAAIPGVLPPVAWEGRMLMDGGVANNTPISHAVELGAERIYVLPTGHACALEEPPDGALGMALHAMSLLTHRRLVEDIERHRADAQLVVLPPPCPLRITPIDFGHAGELIDRALSDARAFLDDGGEEEPAIRMRPHRHRRAGPARRPRAQRELARA